MLAGAHQDALRGEKSEATGDHLGEVLCIALHHIVNLVGAVAGVLVHLADAGQDHPHLIMVEACPGVVVLLMDLQSA